MTITQCVHATALAGFLFWPRLAWAQTSTEPAGPPEWVYADSNLVRDPPWTRGTLTKNIVMLLFKGGTTATRRAAIIQLVHGKVVYNDRTGGDDGFYLIQVQSHSDACGVKQAIDLLKQVPEVDSVEPELVFGTNSSDSIDPGSGLVDAHATHWGSRHPCPPGTALLR